MGLGVGPGQVLDLRRPGLEDRQPVAFAVFPQAIDYTRKSPRVFGVAAGFMPGLLTQELIENAIRHGVARTPGRAELEIGARIEPGETLAIWVENPVPEAGGATATGLGIGLRNVGERLSARHPGHATSCAFGPAGPGRVRVELRMPFRT